MKAVFSTEVSNAKNMSQGKEVIQTINLIGYKNGEFKELVTARWYMGRSSSASVVYCSVWIKGKGFYTSGRGSACGYGYHKQSQAFADALISAGVTLYGSAYGGDRDKQALKEKKTAYIGGVGDGAISSALKAIGVALGYTKTTEVRN